MLKPKTTLNFDYLFNSLPTSNTSAIPVVTISKSCYLPKSFITTTPVQTSITSWLY